MRTWTTVSASSRRLGLSRHSATGAQRTTASLIRTMVRSAGTDAGGQRPGDSSPLDPHHTDAESLLALVFDQLNHGVLPPDLRPEARHLAAPPLRVGMNVVERYEAAGAHQRGVVGDVTPHALPGVIAVDEEEVEGLALEEPEHLLPGRVAVRVHPEKVESLDAPGEAAPALEHRALCTLVRPVGRQVEADQRRLVTGQPRPHVEGLARRRADLEDAARPELPHKRDQPADLSPLLRHANRVGLAQAARDRVRVRRG